MYDAADVKAEIIRRGYTPREICKILSMNERTFYKKLNRGTWYLEEAKALSKAVGFDEETASRLFLH